MRDVDNSAFNRELHRRIEKLKATVADNVTPENISLFDSSIIRKAHILTDNDSGVRFGGNVNVNGVEMSKPRQAISHLVKRGTSIMVIPFASLFSLENSDDSEYRVVSEQQIGIPAGYDVDNTFPVMRFSRSDEGHLLTSRLVFDVGEVMRAAASFDWMYGVNHVDARYRTYRAPGKVTVRANVGFYFNNNAADATIAGAKQLFPVPETNGGCTLFGYLLCWRYE